MIKYICVPWLVTICIVFKRVVLTRIGDTCIQNYSKTNSVIEDKTLIEILGCSMDMVYKIWFLNYKNEKGGEHRCKFYSSGFHDDKHNFVSGWCVFFTKFNLYKIIWAYFKWYIMNCCCDSSWSTWIFRNRIYVTSIVGYSQLSNLWNNPHIHR